MKRIKSALDKTAKSELKKIRQADILIGIPSYKSIPSIGRVVQACILGLAKYFPESRAVIFISEGGESEKVKEAVAGLTIEEDLERSLIPAPSSPAEIVVTDYRGSPGKGSAIKAILEGACKLEAKACCVVDSDLRSITPEWVELLIAPVLEKGFGFVTPYYSRHKYDGTITNLIAYPMTRALYGRRVRQPIGGDFGFSPELAESLLSKNVWETDIAKFGIDIWMTTTAAEEQFKICQSFLGAKIHDEKDPGKDLAPMFVQVVGTLFELMEMYERSWTKITGSRPTAIFGFESEINPKPVTVDVEHLIRSFLSQVPVYQTFWQEILEPENFYKILEVSEIRDRYFELPFEIWVKSVYDFALAYHKREDDRSRILEALIPLYFAAVASFAGKTGTMNSHQVEELINDQCLTFEEWKPYLIHRWQNAQ